MEFRILGPLEVIDDGRSVPVTGAKPRALLAALLLHANEVVSVERLMGVLWEGEPPETAKSALQVYISQLRKALGAETVKRRGGGYAIEFAPRDLDLARFEDLRSEAASLPPAEAADRLREALALWRGEPEFDRLHLEELRLAAFEDRIDADLELGRHEGVIPDLRAHIEEEPLRERLRAQLMLALYRAGRQADALAEFARARDVLIEELGVEPGPELQQLQREVLAHAASLAAPPRARASQLPTPPTPLIGRRRELAEAAAFLRDGVRLVTLTGPGGIGKTRLALELARELEPDLPHGAALIRLATVTDPAFVPDAIAQAAGVPDANRERLLEHLSTRSQLLVLDNFEQLLPAAPFLSELLEAAPDVRLIVTSRAVLRVAGEQEYPVPPLVEAEELFVARARAVDPGFVPDDAVAEICARLDGLPLALELAAARVKLLPVRVIVERLEHSLDLLTGGRADAPARQQTLRAAIDWSYGLLDGEEQRLFVALSYFSGGASLDAIEDVCGGTLDTLASLVDKSLVRRSGDRFTMLELLREYGHEQGVPLDVRRAHLEHYLALAESGHAQRVEAAWLDRLELDHGNLRRALAFALEQDDKEHAGRLAGAIVRLWSIHGHLVEGRQAYEEVLRLPGGASLEVLRKCYAGLGIMLGEQGDYGAAGEAFTRSLEIGRELDDPVAVGKAYTNLATIALFRGDAAEARRLHQAALEQFAGTDEERSRFIGTANMGIVAFGEGELEEAERLLREALAQASEIGDRREEASDLRWLARVRLEVGAVDEARSLLEAGVSAARDAGEWHGVAEALEVAAAIAAVEGSVFDAARLLGAAEAVRTSIGAARAADIKEWYPRTRAHIEELAGDVFEAELERGRALSAEDALQLLVTSAAAAG